MYYAVVFHKRVFFLFLGDMTVVGGLTVNNHGMKTPNTLSANDGLTVHDSGMKVTAGISVFDTGLYINGDVTPNNVVVSHGGVTVLGGGVVVTEINTLNATDIPIHSTGGTTVSTGGMKVTSGITLLSGGFTVTGGMSLPNTALIINDKLVVTGEKSYCYHYYNGGC